jgi:hypothetical protein
MSSLVLRLVLLVRLALVTVNRKSLVLRCRLTMQWAGTYSAWYLGTSLPGLNALRLGTWYSNGLGTYKAWYLQDQPVVRVSSDA